MTVDMDARDITLNYQGGSLTMAVGNAKHIFGEDFAGLDPGSVATQVNVRSHNRVRVIGQPATNVGSYSYTFQQWPTSTASNASAGTVIYMTWTDSGGAFTGRVSGSMAACATFFSENTTRALSFRTQRGTKYGPFAPSEE